MIVKFTTLIGNPRSREASKAKPCFVQVPSLGPMTNSDRQNQG